MNYIVINENQELLPVSIISNSPSGRYFAANVNGYTVFKVIRKENNTVYGITVTKGVNYANEEGYPIHFNKVVWYEQFGFAKILFSDWNSLEDITARLYFDRDLHNRKKQLFHNDKNDNNANQ